MNRLHPIYKLTIQLENLLSEPIQANKRQTIIEKINQLIEERGTYMNKVTPPFTEDEKNLGKQVVKLNEGIQTKMNELFEELKQEMKQVKKKKSSNRNYVNPYKNVQTMDGMFLDKRK